MTTNRLSFVAGMGLLVLFPFLCLATLPPIPEASTNPPPPILVVTNEPGQPPPWTPPPPKIAQFSKWEDGKIYDVTEEGFKIMVDHYKYFVEINTNLVAAEWIRIEEVSNPEFDWAAYKARHPEAFFRVIKRREPHPPTGTWNRLPIGTNTVSGHFRRKTE
jgi:hypothetical protein